MSQVSNSERSAPLQDSVLLTPRINGSGGMGVIITMSDRIVPQYDLEPNTSTFVQNADDMARPAMPVGLS